MEDLAVLVERVTKRFSGHVAVSELDLAVPRGGIFGLLGPNGAGKSTTIRMIMNILVPDHGTISVLGSPVGSAGLTNRLGFLPEERGLYKKMRVADHLIFFGEIKGLARRDAAPLAGRWLERLGLAEWRNRRVEDLSKGMQQKVQFIGALLHHPELVVLDEPFSGLDPVNSLTMREIVRDVARDGRTVLFSTHILEHAEQMCDRIAIIANGRKVLDGALADIKKESRGRKVAVVVAGESGPAMRLLEKIPFVARVDKDGHGLGVELEDRGDPSELLRILVNENIAISRFEVVERSLEAIFVEKVGIAGLDSSGNGYRGDGAS